jgi:hypothetical protein
MLLLCVTVCSEWFVCPQIAPVTHLAPLNSALFCAPASPLSSHLLRSPAGVGISGNEGMQAVRAADYAFAQFRFILVSATLI